jgi:hypothetical protein
VATELIFDFGQGGIISALEEVRENDGSLKEVKVEVDGLIDERYSLWPEQT